jgi:peptide/nickel transport system permease protein
VTTSQPTEFTLDTAAELAAEEHGAPIEGKSPWLLAWRRLRRNKVALGAFGVFLVIVAICLSAPLYAEHVAESGPNEIHLTEKVMVDGVEKDVISAGGTVQDPETGELRIKEVTVLGPTYWNAGGKFVLGADTTGRDVAVRLLYGGINSLVIGITSALICTLLAVLLALLAGYFGGWPDWFITRVFDLIAALPVILLGIALGAALSINGFHHGPIDIDSGSLWIPILVISVILVAYIGRPLRGQILSLREKEFIEASIAQGASPFRVMLIELLPNIASTVLVFFTLIVANNILVESALSFLGAGVQPPEPSWGTLIATGQERIRTAPWLTIVPGAAIVLTVVSLNVFGDGLRDALDPRAKVKVEH